MTIREWAWKQIVSAEYSTTEAIERGVKAFEALDPMLRQQLVRLGVGRAITDEAKRHAKLLIPKNGGPAEQMPLFAAVQLDGKWMRVSYLRADYEQLRALHERERKAAGRMTRRVRRLRYDLGLYSQHRDLPSLQAVWDAEHVSYALDEKAA